MISQRKEERDNWEQMVALAARAQAEVRRLDPSLLLPGKPCALILPHSQSPAGDGLCRWGTLGY